MLSTTAIIDQTSIQDSNVDTQTAEFKSARHSLITRSECGLLRSENDESPTPPPRLLLYTRRLGVSPKGLGCCPPIESFIPVMEKSGNGGKGSPLQWQIHARFLLIHGCQVLFTISVSVCSKTTFEGKVCAQPRLKLSRQSPRRGYE